MSTEALELINHLCIIGCSTPLMHDAFYGKGYLLHGALIGLDGIAAQLCFKTILLTIFYAIQV